MAAPSTATHTESAFTNVRHLSLYTQSWLPNGDLKAIVFLIHGLGEHSARYAWTAAALSQQGYAVFTLDHMGHGRSQGEKAYVERLSYLVDDAIQYIDIVSAKYPQHLPRFLLGHSMGGAISIQIGRRRPDFFRGVILSAPPLKKGSDIGTLDVYLAKIVSVVAPKLGAVKTLEGKLVTRNAELAQEYDNDPLVYHGKMRARTGTEMLAFIEELERARSSVSFPFIILQGTADKICSVEGARAFYEGAASADKRFVEYDGLYHELLNEPERDRVLADILAWIQERIAPPAAAAVPAAEVVPTAAPETSQPGTGSEEEAVPEIDPSAKL